MLLFPEQRRRHPTPVTRRPSPRSTLNPALKCARTLCVSGGKSLMSQFMWNGSPGAEAAQSWHRSPTLMDNSTRLCVFRPPVHSRHASVQYVRQQDVDAHRGAASRSQVLWARSVLKKSHLQTTSLSFAWQLESRLWQRRRQQTKNVNGIEMI